MAFEKTPDGSLYETKYLQVARDKGVCGADIMRPEYYQDKPLKPYFPKDEYRQICCSNIGLKQIFYELKEFGFTDDTVRLSGRIIAVALMILTTLPGVEIEPCLSDSVRKGLEELNSLRADCEANKARCIADAAYVQRVYTEQLERIPEREKIVSLFEKECNERLKKCGEKERELAKREKELEALREEILTPESPSIRDRLRMKEIFLQTIEPLRDQWTNKAIVWSLGAILSGTQIPPFTK